MFLDVFFWFLRFLCFGGTSKIAVLPAWELNFRKLDQHFYVFFDIFGNAKKTCFHLPFFFMFFHHVWCFFGGLWASFGVLLEPLSSLWLSGVILLGAFGLPGLSVDALCYFLWCLWLVWAVCGLGDRSGTVFCSISD